MAKSHLSQPLYHHIAPVCIKIENKFLTSVSNCYLSKIFAYNAIKYSFYACLKIEH